MQQFSSLLSWRLFTAQHVSGAFLLISLFNCKFTIQYLLWKWVKPEAATAVIELLMMGGEKPETCWAVNKCQDNKLENCCIWLVIYLNCTMMHGPTNLKFHMDMLSLTIKHEELSVFLHSLCNHLTPYTFMWSDLIMAWKTGRSMLCM